MENFADSQREKNVEIVTDENRAQYIKKFEQDREKGWKETNERDGKVINEEMERQKSLKKT